MYVCGPHNTPPCSVGASHAVFSHCSSLLDPSSCNNQVLSGGIKSSQSEPIIDIRESEATARGNILGVSLAPRTSAELTERHPSFSSVTSSMMGSLAGSFRRWGDAKEEGKTAAEGELQSDVSMLFQVVACGVGWVP